MNKLGILLHDSIPPRSTSVKSTRERDRRDGEIIGWQFTCYECWKTHKYGELSYEKAVRQTREHRCGQ